MLVVAVVAVVALRGWLLDPPEPVASTGEQLPAEDVELPGTPTLEVEATPAAVGVPAEPVTPGPSPARADSTPVPSAAVAGVELTSSPAPTPATVEATPRPITPRAAPTPTAAPAAQITLRHDAPASLVIGSPTHVSVVVEPGGACRPRLRYAPFDPSDGGWRIQGMSESGGGEWETELHLPYEVAWRSGFRYQLRCEDAGQIVAIWPRSGSQKVPALAR